VAPLTGSVIASLARVVVVFLLPVAYAAAAYMLFLAAKYLLIFCFAVSIF